MSPQDQIEAALRRINVRTDCEFIQDDVLLVLGVLERNKLVPKTPIYQWFSKDTPPTEADANEHGDVLWNRSGVEMPVRWWNTPVDGTKWRSFNAKPIGWG